MLPEAKDQRTSPPQLPVALDVSSGTLTLALSDAAWMFQSPPLDALRGVHDARSGIEQITDAFTLRPLRDDDILNRLHIRVPAAQIDANLERALRTALDGYCDGRRQEADRALRKLRQAQRGALRMGLLFLVVCLMLSTLSGQVQALPAFVRRLATEGFLIAGWVGMWRPLELLLFDWWPHVRAKKLYQRIRRIKLSVSPTPETTLPQIT